MKLTGLLVGQSFRPPAKLLLEALPNGAELILEPEPWNPYDEFAIKILVDPFQLDKEKHDWLAAELPSAGHNLAEIMLNGPVHIGYLAREENKARMKINVTANKVILELTKPTTLNDGETRVGKLRWGPNGETLVDVEITVEIPV